ncbi:UDP-N-acetylmuramoyl-L-alanyl-D-glutamate--2,6-diaminopimelate ligase [Comamonas kerstersii]|uniref:UDP-N-acetylmuramoyl-L-alanyl-D-glutamate--2, 6-diaminopimelate ligase n=1 Tax=Comamonas kerstersii TaxID=225992 RepID=UPI0026DD1D76|nr:UDP-N-acetylmuramoyl-L-alanyl-D-glutamate--2,6-diaminopimelate ligase [Comamonas kerstersii]
MSSAIKQIQDLQQAVAWLRARVSGHLRTDSRQVQPGDGFIAWPGGVTDGRKYVAAALERGAAACLVEQDGLQAFDLQGPVASMTGLKAATALIADAWYGQPSGQLQVLAVTGTNGKTSTAWWLAHALAQYQHGVRKGCAMVGTLGIGVPPAVQTTGMTTPDPVCLQQAFADYAAQGIAACAIEASSIGIEEHRLDGTQIHTSIFTNFTQDHLDYHGSMDAYWQAKARLFAWPGLKAAVINIDDAHGAALAQDLMAQGQLDVWTVAVDAPARLQAKDVRHGLRGLRFEVQEGEQVFTMETGLIGQYNVSNMLGVLATLRTLGIGLVDAVQICADLEPVPGRMQQIALPEQPLVVVDYAHTPDALEQALKGLQPVARARGGKLHCVFGCGGNRDATKRPLMGQAAQRQADVVWVTSDNPRGEVPDAIVQDIVQGMQLQGVHVQADRTQAITQAIAQADAHDVVLLAGKGHEDYQEIQGVKYPFSDMDKARGALALRKGSSK